MCSRYKVLGMVLLALLVLSGCATQQAKGPKSEAPALAPSGQGGRAGLVITHASTRGEVTDKLARFHMELEAESYRQGEQRFFLFGGETAITGWSVKKSRWGPQAYIRPSDGGVELVVTGKGSYKLSLDFVVRVREERLGHKLSLPVVRALAAETQLAVPGVDLEFSAEPAVSMETRTQDEMTNVTVYGGEGVIVLAWTPKAPPKVLKPVVFADQTLRVRIGQGVMRLDSTIDYAIVQGSLREFEIRIPLDCSLLDIKGQDIRTWDLVDGLLKVSLLAEVEKQYRLSLSLEKVLPDIEMEVELPAIEPLNVTREKGQVAVSAARGISVEAVTLEDASPVDVRELMALPQVKGEEIRLGFRYLKRPFTLKLRTGEVVAKTSVEILTLVRAGMDTMRLTAELNYTIRDAGVFGFRVRLDEGLRLIDINGPNINNWQLDEAARVLTVALRAKAEGEYRLQIETELEQFAAEKAAVPTVEALDVDRETGYVAVLPAPGMKVETSELSGIAQVDVKELPGELLGQSPALGYRYIRPGYQVSINVSEIEPEVHAEVRTVATLDELELNLDTEIQYTIRRAGIFQLRVAIPKDLRRTNIEGKDIDDTSWDEKAGVLTVNLRSKVEGGYLLKLETERTLAEIEKGVELPVIQTLGVKKERGFLAVVSKASLRVKPAEGKMVGLDDVSVSDLPPEMLRRAPKVLLAFKYFTQPWSLALAIERIEPRITAEVFNLLSVGEKLVTLSSTVNYSILHAGVDTFTVKLPPDATAVDIDGEGIKHREEDKKESTWTVTLHSKSTDNYMLYVSFQVKLAKDQAVIPYTGVQALKVERETGYLAITSRADVELTVADQDIENLTAIDSREVPESYMQGVALPVLLAFRYVTTPYVVRIGALPHDAAEVTVAVVESANLSSTLTEEGNMITDLALMLRNSRQQYLDLKLPESAQIWHAFVAGEAVTPLRDGALTKVPVARAAGSKTAFEVRLRYSDERAKLGRVGSVKLESPMQGIDIMRLGWTLSLPEGYDIVRDMGNLKRLDTVYAMDAALRNLNPDAEVRAPVRRTASLPAKRSGQARRNIKAIEAVQAETGQRGQQQVSIYTGSKPQQASIFAFQSLIVRGEERAWVQVQYVKSSVGMPLKGVLVVILLVGAALIWRWRKYPRIIRIAILAGCALIALAVRTLVEEAYRDYLTTVVVTLAVVAGLLLLYTIAAWIRGCWGRLQARTAEKREELQVPPAPQEPEVS